MEANLTYCCKSGMITGMTGLSYILGEVSVEAREMVQWVRVLDAPSEGLSLVSST